MDNIVNHCWHYWNLKKKFDATWLFFSWGCISLVRAELRKKVESMGFVIKKNHDAEEEKKKHWRKKEEKKEMMMTF